ncbi:GIY-YIG nuclease family protein [Fulvimarina sp. 2208YS6-2-32]|uniref:GIY-YIG nuclease family protein n=1 Tax=Fulvimarina uroteuthidis TaxID=3098149 RepID=A0ABU5I3T9_9HYPH|nr:GIY-YIG nuclease family protein [Fulvimarina sp. 2208YS6-2-32]MDY8110017.1 GIY-YIG nuclease family protein [Fulvimarina sp. 2208YS6-2-32]
MGGWVYIMASQRNGTFHIGVTSDPNTRVQGHRDGSMGGFTARYGVKTLVRHERHDDIERAIQRDNSLKRYRRAWKIRPIEEINPRWDDLFETVSDKDNPFQGAFVSKSDDGSEDPAISPPPHNLPRPPKIPTHQTPPVPKSASGKEQRP